MAYRAVLFDLDNTLLDYDRSERESMRYSLLQHGLDPDDTFFWEPFWNHFSRSNTKYWLERFERKLHIMEILELSYRDAFVAMGYDASEPRQVASAYWRHFCCLFHPEDGAEETIVRLHGSYKLGIVSNGIGEAQHQRLQAGRLLDRFDVVVVSDEAGAAKPDPRIFAAALDRLDTAPGDVLFVGDSLTDDYAGAQAAGIDFCLYNPRRKPLPPGIQPAYKIEHLKDLFGILHGKSSPY